MLTFASPADVLKYQETLRERGRALVARVCHLGGSRYEVPSATGVGSYQVDLSRETCTCPSWARLNGLEYPELPRPWPPTRCKHCWASVIYAQQSRERKVA